MAQQDVARSQDESKRVAWKCDARLALIWASAIALYYLVTTLMMRGLDLSDGIFGPYGIFRKIAIVLSFPSVMLWRLWGHGAGEYLANSDTSTLLVLNFVTYFLGIFALLRLVHWWKQLPQDPHSVHRRKLIIGSVAGVGALAGGIYLRKDRTNVEVVPQVLNLPDLPPEMQGWKLVLLADLHRGPFVDMDYLKRIVDLCNAQNPDLVCVAGDFIYQDPKYFLDVAQFLKKLKYRVALFGTLGNHDHWQGGMAAVNDMLVPVGMRFLDNTRVFITSDGRVSESPDGAALCVAGVGDEWEDVVDFNRALRGVPASMPRLVITHNPDAAECPGHAQHRVDAMLAGHTHGGQVSLPALGTILVPTKYGDKYVAGWCQGPSFPVYVNRGIGMTVLPIRSGSQPEITVFTLKGAAH